jgi:hypothetical protein
MAPEGDRVFVFKEQQGETEFNLRLGKALLGWAESSGNDSWAGVARSLILSVLSLDDGSGLVKTGVLLSAEGEITEDPAPSKLTTAKLYHILRPGEYGPKALPIAVPANTVWTWTAARQVSASLQNDVLDISVSFPAGETHYMIIRGIRPFAKIQLYNMDFRTDSQFERYDSSGWSYNAREQALILKMKHRTTVEHVRIFYRNGDDGRNEADTQGGAETDAANDTNNAAGTNSAAGTDDRNSVTVIEKPDAASGQANANSVNETNSPAGADSTNED